MWRSGRGRSINRMILTDIWLLLKLVSLDSKVTFGGCLACMHVDIS